MDFYEPTWQELFSYRLLTYQAPTEENIKQKPNEAWKLEDVRLSAGRKAESNLKEWFGITLEEVSSICKTRGELNHCLTGHKYEAKWLKPKAESVPF